MGNRANDAVHCHVWIQWRRVQQGEFIPFDFFLLEHFSAQLLSLVSILTSLWPLSKWSSAYPCLSLQLWYGYLTVHSMKQRNVSDSGAFHAVNWFDRWVATCLSLSRRFSHHLQCNLLRTRNSETSIVRCTVCQSLVHGPDLYSAPMMWWSHPKLSTLR